MPPSGTVVLLWSSAFAVLAALAVLVLQRITGKRDPQIWPKFGVQLCLIAGFFLPAWWGSPWFDVLCLSVALVCVYEVIGLWRRKPEGAPGTRAEILLAVGFIVLGAGCLRTLVVRGAAHFIFFYALVELNDSFADIVGRHVGKSPLFPSLSPRKTWEGMLAGLAAASGSAALLAPYLEPDVGVATCTAIGFVVGACAVVADLSASALKRRFSAKDFSTLVPKHGGLLDACDSLLMVAPLFLAVLLASGR